MNPLIGMLASQLSGPVLSQISQQIGADNGTTQNAINTALPMLLSAFNNNGADGLQQAAQNNDGILDDVMGFLGSGQAGNIGGALLSQFVGGNNNNAIANLIGQQSGLNSGAAMQLLGLLAPIVMGAMSKSSGGDANGIADLLGSAVNSTAGNDLLGAATKLLDSDGDGSVMDEIGSLLQQFI